jgi:hypothetical protein
MMASVLLAGRLAKDPEPRVSTKTGRPYVSVSLRDGDGETAVWWNVLAFDEEDCGELLRLQAGDAIAATGSFSVAAYERDGKARARCTILVERLISPQRRKKRQTEERRALTYEGAS